MIPLCGIAIALAIAIIIVYLDMQETMPTKEDEDQLTNKLNRMALDRANERNKP